MYRIVSIRPLILNSFSPLSKSLWTVPRAPITISITVTLTFHSFFSSLAGLRTLFFFLLSLLLLLLLLLVWFVCLMAYQPSWYILCESPPYTRTVDVLFNPQLGDKGLRNFPILLLLLLLLVSFHTSVR